MNRLVKICLLSIVLPIVLITIFLLSMYIRDRRETVAEWNKIKTDYEMINNIAMDYYDKNCSERGSDNNVISLEFSNDFATLIDCNWIYENGKVIEDHRYINLSQVQQEALRNIANFYQGQECIIIRPEEIIYTDNDAVGAYQVIYVKNKIKFYFDFFGRFSEIKHLKENWYYFHAR